MGLPFPAKALCDRPPPTTNEDGYILGMFHMPPTGTPNGKVVLLQHALLAGFPSQ